MDTESLDSWSWTQSRSLAMAQDLIATVRAAEEAETASGDEPQRWNPPMYSDGLARAHWYRALELTDALSDSEPGPFPPAVQDAIERTQAAAELLQLTSPGDQSAG